MGSCRFERERFDKVRRRQRESPRTRQWPPNQCPARPRTVDAFNPHAASRRLARRSHQTANANT